MAEETTQQKQAKKKNEPMVVVHKADGTTEKISLSELKARRSKVRQQKKKSVQAVQPKAQKPATEALATTTPVKDIFKDEAIAVSRGKKSKNQKKKQSVDAPRKAPRSVKKDTGHAKQLRPQGNVSAFRAQMQTLTSSSAKSSVSDIVAPIKEKSTMGPVEEIHTFGLVDFRRLAPRPKEAASKLIGKFHGYKEESFMLYMETRDAWRASPLYKAYRDVALQSLIEGKTVDGVLSAGEQDNGMIYDEFHELVGVNMQLS